MARFPSDLHAGKTMQFGSTKIGPIPSESPAFRILLWSHALSFDKDYNSEDEDKKDGLMSVPGLGLRSRSPAIGSSLF